MSERWKWYLPGHVFNLPGTVIGLLILMALFPWMKPDAIRWRQGMIHVRCKNILFQPGAQTWGVLIFAKPDEPSRLRWGDVGLFVHEHTHGWQSAMMTYPVYAILWLGHWGIRFARNAPAPPEAIEKNPKYWNERASRLWRAYRGIFLERHAYNVEDKFNQGKIDNAWGAV